MRRLGVAALLVACVGLGGAGRAEEKKAGPTGTWKWTVEAGGMSREMTLKLKQDGDKLTGHLVGRQGRETKIEDGKVKGDEISFQVTRERDGQKFVIKYSGKVSGDTIKGKAAFERDGQTQSRDWTATRAKE